MSNVIDATLVNPTNNYQTRQEAARLACVEAGIVWPETILPEGTALYTSGVDKLKGDRAAWRRLPLASEVVGLIETALQAEDRQDYVQTVSDIRFRPSDGRIVRSNHVHAPVTAKMGLGYGPHTLRQLVAQIDPLDDAPRGFAGALLYLTDSERANILNDRLARMKPADVPVNVTMRTKLAHSGGRIARAALSERYGSVTDFDIARALGESLKGDASGRLDYKPGDSHSRFEVIWPSEIPVETFVVGDVHYACLAIENCETGQGRLRISPAVVRARCANLTVSVGEGTEVSIRHVGSHAGLMYRLKLAIRAASESLEPLIQTISMSARITVAETWTPERAFAAIARRYALPASSVPVWQDAAKRGNYPVTTVWGLANSISDAAHGRDTWSDSAEWERAASAVQSAAVEAFKGGAADAFGRAVNQ